MVIAIILVLAGLALPVLHRARVKSVTVKTKAIIASLETALSMYETDFGDYPPGDGGSRILVDLLQGPVESPYWHGPYMRFKQEDLDQARNVVDAWRTPLSYQYPQTRQSNVLYLLSSAGPDRQFGTDDDIGNW